MIQSLLGNAFAALLLATVLYFIFRPDPEYS